MGNGVLSKSLTHTLSKTISVGSLQVNMPVHDEREVFHKLWTKTLKSKGHVQLSAEIFRGILKQSPSMPLLFGLERIEQSEWHRTTAFMEHAAKMLTELNEFVTLWCSGKNADLRIRARKLGKMHCTKLEHKHNGKQFHPSLWMCLPDVLNKVLLTNYKERQFTKEDKESRAQIEVFGCSLANMMRGAYNDAQQQRQTKK